jgi:hypothetical protein
MNVYDFDKTICFKDSTFAFWCFCLKRYPWIIVFLPIQMLSLALHRFGITDRPNRWWMYLRFIQVDQEFIKKFADKHEKNICEWYLQQKQPDDVIVSAAADFIIQEMCHRLGVAYVASQVDIETGRYLQPACHGREKVRQFRAAYPDAVVHKSYGNAESDQYIMNEGQHAYLVRNFSNTNADFQQWH